MNHHDAWRAMRLDAAAWHDWKVQEEPEDQRRWCVCGALAGTAHRHPLPLPPRTCSKCAYGEHIKCTGRMAAVGGTVGGATKIACGCTCHDLVTAP